MNHRILSLAAAIAAVLALAGCQETASDTASDVAAARDDANKTDSEARQDAERAAAKANDQLVDAQQTYADTEGAARQKLTSAAADTMVSAAKAQYEVDKTATQGRYNVAVEKCDGLSGADRDACTSRANSVAMAEEAQAVATRDAAIADASRHE